MKIILIIALFACLGFMRSKATHLLTESTAMNGEPLLRFPFIDSFVDPCVLVLPTSSEPLDNWSNETANYNSSNRVPRTSRRFPLRVLATDETPLPQQVLQFLKPVRDIYNRRPNTAFEERLDVIREFYSILLEVKHRTDHMFPRSAIHQCSNIQHHLLSIAGPTFTPSGSARNTNFEEIYRGLAIASAHLHLTNLDIIASSRCYPFETRANRQNMRILAGKVEFMMCLTWSFAKTPSVKNPDFLKVVDNLLQATVHRNFDCSARQIRRCLIARYLRRVIEGIHKVLNKELQRMGLDLLPKLN